VLTGVSSLLVFISANLASYDNDSTASASVPPSAFVFVASILVLMAALGLYAAAKAADDLSVFRPRTALVRTVCGLGIASAGLFAEALISATAPPGAIADYARNGSPDGGAVLAICASGGIIALLLFVAGDIAIAARRRIVAVRAPLPRVDSLADRVAQAQESLAKTGESVRATLEATTESLREALASTTVIVDALEAELRTRRSALDELTAQAQAAEARADQARDLARIEESTAKALDALLDRRLAERLEVLESAGHRWDAKLTLWTQLPNLMVGIAAGYLVAVLIGH
jgi:hypothetical protein